MRHCRSLRDWSAGPVSGRSFRQAANVCFRPIPATSVTLWGRRYGARIFASLASSGCAAPLVFVRTMMVRPSST